MTVTDYLRKRLLKDIAETDRKPSYASLKKTEWSPEFERLMRNRLIMGAIRYGLLGSPNKPQYDRIEYMRRKLKEYKESGNLECLVDVANLALCEFVEGKHPKSHFNAVDNTTNHANVIKAGGK